MLSLATLPLCMFFSASVPSLTQLSHADDNDPNTKPVTLVTASMDRLDLFERGRRIGWKYIDGL